MKKMDSQQDKKRSYYINEWKEQEAYITEIKEAIVTLSDTGRKFPLTTALLLEQVQSFSVDCEKAFEKLAEFGITTHDEAIRAAVELKGGEQ